MAYAYCAIIITFIITPINCITVTFIIISFNSVVSKQVWSSSLTRPAEDLQDDPQAPGAPSRTLKGRFLAINARNQE